MTGDMVSWDMENIEEVKILIKSLSEVYPIYYTVSYTHLDVYKRQY